MPQQNKMKWTHCASPGASVFQYMKCLCIQWQPVQCSQTHWQHTTFIKYTSDILYVYILFQMADNVMISYIYKCNMAEFGGGATPVYTQNHFCQSVLHSFKWVHTVQDSTSLFKPNIPKHSLNPQGAGGDHNWLKESNMASSVGVASMDNFLFDWWLDFLLLLFPLVTLRFLVWILSFFIASGLLTWNTHLKCLVESVVQV